MITAFIILSFVFLLVSVLPALRITHWSIQVLDYIRVQLLSVQIIVFISSFFINNNNEASICFSQIILLLSIIYQLYIILPYLPVSSIFKSKKIFNKNNREKAITIVSSNVLQKNKDYSKLIELVKTINPDILLTTETNNAWENALKAIENGFSYNYKIALENRYGMHLYTKLKAVKIKEHFLLSDQIPSLEAHLINDNGSRFVFWGVHPPPPSPTEKPTSKQNDAELAKLAKMITATGYPSIVVGDFNDVSWSRSVKLFAEISKLKDIRLGRGVFGTFPVKPAIFRFPLDLIFYSNGFRVVKFKRLLPIGSDHLPIFCRMTLLSSKDASSEELDADLKKKADKIIKEGQQAVEEE